MVWRYYVRAGFETICEEETWMEIRFEWGAREDDWRKCYRLGEEWKDMGGERTASHGRARSWLETC